jgi:hypothetical protein
VPVSVFSTPPGTPAFRLPEAFGPAVSYYLPGPHLQQLHFVAANPLLLCGTFIAPDTAPFLDRPVVAQTSSGTLALARPQSKKRARPSAAGSCHPSPFGLSVWHRGLHSQSARTSFLRFGATRSFLTHCTFRPTAGSRLFFLTRSFFDLLVSFFEEKKQKFSFLK